MKHSQHILLSNLKAALLLTLLVFSHFAKAQERKSLPHSTIHIIRTGNAFASACEAKISLPYQQPFILGLKSMVDFTIYSKGSVPVILHMFCDPITKNKQLNLDVESGKEYFVVCDGMKFSIVDKAEAEKNFEKVKDNVIAYEEDINNPIVKGSLDNAFQAKQGSGFLLNKDGYVITNFHVVDGAKKIVIKGIKGDYNTSVEAKVISVDQQNDLALLKIDSKLITFDTPPYAISSSKDVQQGQNVFAMGYPIQSVMGSEVKVTSGIISAKSGYKGSISEFQFSASVQPGNSGGPLFDQNGQVIGIVSAKISAEGVEAVGYAIKSDYLKFFLDQVGNITYNTQGQLTGKSLSEEVGAISPFVYIINAE